MTSSKKAVCARACVRVLAIHDCWVRNEVETHKYDHTNKYTCTQSDTGGEIIACMKEENLAAKQQQQQTITISTVEDMSVIVSKRTMKADMSLSQANRYECSCLLIRADMKTFIIQKYYCFVYLFIDIYNKNNYIRQKYIYLYLQLSSTGKYKASLRIWPRRLKNHCHLYGQIKVSIRIFLQCNIGIAIGPEENTSVRLFKRTNISIWILERHSAERLRHGMVKESGGKDNPPMSRSAPKFDGFFLGHVPSFHKVLRKSDR